MKTAITLEQIAPRKINLLGNPEQKELHPIERAAFDYCVKHQLDRKAWRELVDLIKKGHQLNDRWERMKLEQGRITDVISYQLTQAMQEHD